jgi:formylglycine-generating enzyme required for sulfatase activity/serine/threonine protein kinase
MVGNMDRAGQNAGFHSFLLPAHADGLPERLLDDVLTEQRRDWIAGKRIPADETLRQHPELADEPACAAELIYHEFSLRQELGESPDWQQQLWQYPGHAALLERLRQADQLVEQTLAAPAQLPAGTFADYELLEEVGRGGMGVVFKARHKSLDRIVALKVLRSDDTVEGRKRFDREARAVARLQHPNIVQVYEVGETAGQAFVSLEFVDGQSLARRLYGTPPSARQTAALVEILARAMHYAHEKGVIHRDLKPSNIMMRQADGTVEPVIVDFGLARCIEPSSARLTASGLSIGTWQYMTPEQLCGEPDALGPGCDIYALGVIMYELLTGRLPFDAPGQVVRGDPAPPSSCRADVDPRLEAICLKAMAANSAARYASMGDLASVLADYLRSGPAAAGPGNLVPNTVDKAAIFQAPAPVPDPLADVTPAQRVSEATRAAIDRALPPARPPVWSNPLLVTGIACVLITIAIGFWASGVFRVRTADGVLVVQVNVPNPDLYVDGEKVTVVWQNGGVKAEIGVRPGTRKVELKKGGFRAYGEEVTLEDHGRTVLVARLDPGESTSPTQKVKVTPREVEPSHEPLPPTPDRRDVVHVGLRPLNCTGLNGVSAEVVRRAQEAWAKYLGRDVEEDVEIANGVTMTFVLAPPGKFLMGSPPDETGKNGRYPNETLHVVTLTEPFDLGKYEVTQAQYAALTGKSPSYYKGANRPVEQVTWDEADAFGRGLTEKLSDRHVYRLATEAEWEYSCRGGRPSSEPFGIGDGRSLTPRDANFNNTLRQTSKVGSYAANALGLFDMHGNVWEWCADWNEPYPDGAATNYLRVVGGPFRVARGGCHNEPAAECRSALRQGSPVERRDCWMGFRLARSVPSAGIARVGPTN